MKITKLKPITLLGVSMFFVSLGFAQSISPQSVNSSGKNMSQSNGSLSFTVGELVVLAFEDNDGNTLGGGFTSAATITTVGIQEADANILDVKIYPNPTTELLSIKINHTTLDFLNVLIVDVAGKEIYNEKYTGISNTIGINTASYATGTYMLYIKDQENNAQSVYKIIKQ